MNDMPSFSDQNPSIEMMKEAVLWISDAEGVFSKVPKLKTQAKRLNAIACKIFTYIDELEESP